jgi:hypothetical protein
MHYPFSCDLSIFSNTKLWFSVELRRVFGHFFTKKMSQQNIFADFVWPLWSNHGWRRHRRCSIFSFILFCFFALPFAIAWFLNDDHWPEIMSGIDPICISQSDGGSLWLMLYHPSWALLDLIGAKNLKKASHLKPQTTAKANTSFHCWVSDSLFRSHSVSLSFKTYTLVSWLSTFCLIWKTEF